MDVSELLPGGGLVVREVVIDADAIRLTADSTATTADCPGCGTRSGRVHGRYLRTAADLPWQGRRVAIRIRVRRFRCDNGACPRRTFAERLPMVTPHAQTTGRLAEAHRSIGFALGGEPGSRLARRLAMPTSPDTLLRRVRQADLGPIATPRVLGVDDFAFRRAATYGTILVDLVRGRVVDLLPDREAATLAGWLRAHAGPEVISRDRASAYALAAREAAPDAVQVADRWHLLANLRDTLERCLHRRSATVRTILTDRPAAAAAGLPVADPAGAGDPAPARRSARQGQRSARFELVRRMHRDGLSLRRIARSLGLNYATVERYVRSDACPDWQPGRTRPSLLDRHRGYIRQRLGEGCRNAVQIHRELREMGCSCGKTVVKCLVRQLLTEDARPSTPSQAPAADRGHPALLSFRQLAIAIVRRPGDRSAEDALALESLGSGDAAIGELITMAERFAALVRDRRGPDLPGWLEEAERSPVREVRSFALRLRQDEAAVRAGMELGWSNGPTEGHVGRLKLVKRMMFGRAGFDLLRARVLHAG